MSDINTNNVSFNDSGTAILSGVSSGIDTQGLVNSIIEAKRFEIVRIDKKIDVNAGKISSMQEFKGLVESFQTSLGNLRGGLGYGQTSVFDQKQAFTSSRLTAGAPVGAVASSADSILGVSIDPAKASVGQNKVEVVQLAQSTQLRSGAFTSRSSTLVSEGVTAGQVQIGDVTVDIDADDTLLDLRDKINFANGNVSASIITASPTEHYLVLNGTDTGAANAVTIGGDLATHNSLGLTDAGTTNITHEIQSAQDAIMRVNGLGVDIYRENNTVTDVIDGVTLDLFQAEVGTEVVIDVETNLNAVKEEIFNFTEAYNAIKEFVSDQRTEKVRSDAEGAEKEYGDLAFDATVRRVAQEIDQLINIEIPGTADGYGSLVEIGIGINESYRLEMDEGTFDAKLVADVKEMEKLFAFSYQTSDSRFRPLEVPNSIANNVNGSGGVDPYYVNIAPQDADGKLVSANYSETAGSGAGGANNSSFEVSGNIITGLNGELDDMKFIYAGQANGPGVDDIQFSFTRGIADQLFTTLDNFLADDGQISEAINGFNESTESLEESKTTIESRLELERSRLVRVFSAMERSVAISNSILEQLKQQSAAMEN